MPIFGGMAAPPAGSPGVRPSLALSHLCRNAGTLGDDGVSRLFCLPGVLEASTSCSNPRQAAALCTWETEGGILSPCSIMSPISSSSLFS